MAWEFLKNATEKEEVEVEIKPSDLKKRFEDDDNRYKTITEKLGSLDNISEYIAEQRKEKSEREQRLAAEAARNKQKEQSENPADWIADPEDAANRVIGPIYNETLRLRARDVRRDVFENSESYEFYTGDFKKEVDKLLDQQPLANQANRDVIDNCYFVVLGKKSEQLKENKLKSRFAATSNGPSGTGAPGASSTDAPYKLTDAQKRAAKIFGISEENYAKQAESLEADYV
jgi:hypothetical protein